MKGKVIPDKESITVEFKSDLKRLPDRDLIAAVVCLVNTEGGEIYLGVEKNSKVTGLHQAHQNIAGLTALIANRTNPPVSVRVELLMIDNKRVAKIIVPKSKRLVSTSEGVLQRRRLMADGTPECIPFYPHEFVQRESDLGILDYSSLPVTGASVRDLDPLERERLRPMVERYGGGQERDGALGFIRREHGRQAVTVTGLLMIGKEQAIRSSLPVHEVAFQVMNGVRVKVNEFYRSPLLRIFEKVMDQFEARVEEDEVHVGLFRVPVPSFDKQSFREAFVNAMTHRDYTRLGTLYVRFDGEGLTVSNPGGFVEGVNINNILVVEPKPRNPLLADVVKRIGLAERTGRGVDLIYQGLLRYGRPAPDYSRSDNTTVIVRLLSTEADIPFLRLIVEEESRTGTPISIDSLIILARLRRERRLDISVLASAIQKDEPVQGLHLNCSLKKG